MELLRKEKEAEDAKKKEQMEEEKRRKVSEIGSQGVQPEGRKVTQYARRRITPEELTCDTERPIQKSFKSTWAKDMEKELARQGRKGR